ncbi:hypothetical protein ACIBL6_14180 [Streptomyces sp. NPDC050400]|uniref:hypothetical protein n=1 Tax=Streptomyces sp. NPDC050400 TaxID=3365610 RepID=UPI0037A26AAC
MAIAALPAGRADHAPEAWLGAIIAHRLTDAADPIVDATDLAPRTDWDTGGGALATIVMAAPDHEHSTGSVRAPWAARPNITDPADSTDTTGSTDSTPSTALLRMLPG